MGQRSPVLGLLALAFVPIPVIFIRYGERLRKHPRFQVAL